MPLDEGNGNHPTSTWEHQIQPAACQLAASFHSANEFPCTTTARLANEFQSSTALEFNTLLHK